MKKLTAKRCREKIEMWERLEREYCLATTSEDHLQAYRLALPVLEQQEVMSVPAFYIVYHPNPNPEVNDDKEHSECGSIHLARKLAAKIGGTIRPVYVGPKMERQERERGEEE